MARLQIAVLTAAVALGAVACSGGTDGEPLTDQTSEAPSAPIESAAPRATDPLESVPAEKMLGFVASVVRADDGTAVVVSTNEYATRSTYRLYDSRWRPLTPVLQLRGELRIDRGLAHAFVGGLYAYRENGHPRVSERIIVSRDGMLTTVEDRSGRRAEPVRTRPGDRTLGDAPRQVYRPATRTIHRVTTPEWDHTSRFWSVTAAGDVCALESESRIGATIHASVDEGRTFTDLSTAILPVDSGPRVQSCETAADRVAVMTGGEYPQWVHVLDRTGGALLVSHYVGDQSGPYNPYGWRLLPDGKLVFDTNRPGLYVATDTSNNVLEYRPQPRTQYRWTIVVGEDLALVSSNRQIYVSSDEGRTWTSVDL